MTEEKLIEELLMEASGLGLRNEVLDASEKYIDQGLSRLEALEAAFNELTDDEWNDDEDDDEWPDDIATWPDWENPEFNSEE